MKVLARRGVSPVSTFPWANGQGNWDFVFAAELLQQIATT